MTKIKIKKLKILYTKVEKLGELLYNKNIVNRLIDYKVHNICGRPSPTPPIKQSPKKDVPPHIFFYYIYKGSASNSKCRLSIVVVMPSGFSPTTLIERR